MIEYVAIVAITLAQIGVYIWMDKHSHKLSKVWLLIGFLIAQLFVFPQIAIALYGLNDQQCGMPSVALHLFFIVLGGGLNLIVHFTYYFIKKNNIKQKP